jgi:phytoene synthase
MVEGVKRDITQCRYETFDDLVTYCYGVASTVGLMSMHIIGFHNVEAVLYAIRLGIALQLTNILRDIGEDWRKGRLYLPQEELDHFKLGERDIVAGKVNEHWRSFMRFQIERNRLIYRQAIPGIRLLHADGSLLSTAPLYQAILEDGERHDYSVFDRRYICENYPTAGICRLLRTS